MRRATTIHPFRLRVASLPLLTSIALTAQPAAAQAPKPPEPVQYQLPPAAIADLIDAPQTPAVSLSPDHAWMVLMEPPALPPIAELAQPELRLAGLRINPRTNGPSREWYFKGLSFKRIADGVGRAIAGLPDNPRITRVTWSPDAQADCLPGHKGKRHRAMDRRCGVRTGEEAHRAAAERRHRLGVQLGPRQPDAGRHLGA